MFEQKLQDLIDRDAIGRLLDRYALAFDLRNFSAALPSLFAKDCAVELPPGSHRGLAGLGSFHAAVMAPFARTQHVFANYIIDVAGNQARFRASTLITHVGKDDAGAEDELFVVGGTLEGDVIRKAGVWLISRAKLEPIWRHGEGLGPDMQIS